MALGDPTSTSTSSSATGTAGSSLSSPFTPTSTIIPATSTPGLGDGNGSIGGESPFFKMGTSPPLIIGFIAIGTFALGVIALCAWRRITGRDLALGGRDGGGNGVGGGWGEGSKVVLGKKPELFEVWWDEGDEKGYGYRGGGERPVSEVSEKGKRASFAAREDLSWQSLMVRTMTIAVEGTLCAYLFDRSYVRMAFASPSPPQS